MYTFYYIFTFSVASGPSSNRCRVQRLQWKTIAESFHGSMSVNEEVPEPHQFIDASNLDVSIVHPEIHPNHGGTPSVNLTV